MWVMGEWAVGYWIVGVTSFQKIYGLYGLKRYIVQIIGDVTKAGRTGQMKDRATQLLNRETLSFAILTRCWRPDALHACLSFSFACP